VASNLTEKNSHKRLTTNNKWKYRLFLLVLHTFLLVVSEPTLIKIGNPIDGTRMSARHPSITGIHIGNSKKS